MLTETEISAKTDTETENFRSLVQEIMTVICYCQFVFVGNDQKIEFHVKVFFKKDDQKQFFFFIKSNVSLISVVIFLKIKIFVTFQQIKSLKTVFLNFRSGVLNLLVPTYPQIKIVLLCVPPNQNCMPFAYPQIKNSTQMGFF